MTGRSLVKLLFGFAIGFVGAFATLQAIERFGPQAAAEPFEVVLGAPDFDGYCDREADGRLRGVATTGDPYGWRCVGTVVGLWTTEPVTVDDVCQWEHGPDVVARLVDAQAPDGWICVIPR